MECSNKGLCDRTTATCTCFVGYEGTSCQRASCPNACSGHGVCKSNRELAADDHGNIYELWDADIVSRVQRFVGTAKKNMIALAHQRFDEVSALILLRAGLRDMSIAILTNLDI